MARYVAAVKKFAGGEEGASLVEYSLAGRPARRREHLHPLWAGPEHQEYVRPGQQCGRNRKRRDHLGWVAVTSERPSPSWFAGPRVAARQPSSYRARGVGSLKPKTNPSSGGRRDRPAVW